MDYAFLLLLILANVGMFVWYFKVGHPRHRWLNPLAILLVNYALHFPVRAVAILAFGYGESYHFDILEIALALLFGTVFVLVLLIVYLRPLNSRANEESAPSTGPEETASGRFFIHVLFLLYLVSFTYLLLIGSLFWLGTVEMGPAAKLAKLVLFLKWFLLGYYVVVGRKRLTWLIIAELTLVVLTILVTAVVSTAKGELVWLLVLVCLWATVERRPLPRKTMAAGAALMVVFALYSYLARYYGTVTGRSDIESVRDNIELALESSEDPETLRVKGVDSSIDRFSGIDGLALCQRRGTFLEDNPYQWGSLVELLLLIPRSIWQGRPKVSFNMFVSHDIWGMPWYIESATPLGRIGEAFYVLNWGGLVYAVMYGFLWRWLHRRLYLDARSLITRAFYIALLYLAIFPDDNLVPSPLTTALLAGIAVVGWLLEGIGHARQHAAVPPTEPVWRGTPGNGVEGEGLERRMTPTPIRIGVGRTGA